MDKRHLTVHSYISLIPWIFNEQDMLCLLTVRCSPELHLLSSIFADCALIDKLM